LLGEKAKQGEAGRLADDRRTPVIAVDHYLAAERLRAEHANATQGREKQSWTKEQEQLSDRMLDAYKEAIKLDEKLFWAHLQRGKGYLAQRKEDLALNSLGTAVAVRPDYPWGYAERGNALALLRQFKLARADVDRAISLAPELRGPRAYRGMVNWLDKRYDDALADLDAALAPPAKMRVLEAAFYRGQLHLERNEPDKARADFSDVIKRFPKGHPASLRRARIYFAEGDFKRGLADLDSFLTRTDQFHPDSAQVAAERGLRMRAMVGELPREPKELRKKFLLLSHDLIKKAIAAGARSSSLYSEFGAVLEHLGAIEEAIRAYDEAIKRSSKDARLLVKRAWAHEKLDQFKPGAADFTAALQLDPDYAEAHAGLGYMQACMDRNVAGSSRHAAEAILRVNGDPLLLYNVGCVYGKLSARLPERAREYQDMVLTYLQRAVELWRRDRTGVGPTRLSPHRPGVPSAAAGPPGVQEALREAVATGIAARKPRAHRGPIMRPDRRRRLEIDQQGSVTVVRMLDAELVHPDLIDVVGRRLLRVAGDLGCRLVVLDMARAGHLGSGMIGKILGLYKRLRDTGGRLALCNVSPGLREILEALRVAALLGLHATERAAVAALEVPPSISG
jgi:tetratricopeptide (TPR) repeat protein/anti-anti-sigma regulatory factor